MSNSNALNVPTAVSKWSYWNKVEYWSAENQRWTDEARIMVNKSKDKLYLRFNLRPTKPISPNATNSNHLDPLEPEEAKIEFRIGKTMEIAFCDQFAQDFHVTFRGGGEVNPHLIAFYGEDEGQQLIAFLTARGVLIEVKKSHSNPFLPQWKPLSTFGANLPQELESMKKTKIFVSKAHAKPPQKNNTPLWKPLNRRNSMTQRSHYGVGQLPKRNALDSPISDSVAIAANEEEQIEEWQSEVKC